MCSHFDLVLIKDLLSFSFMLSCFVPFGFNQDFLYFIALFVDYIMTSSVRVDACLSE